MISRVAGSLLKTLNLPELITTSLDEYRALAIDLAENPERLTALRTRLATARDTSTLFDATHFARKIERAYETMWQIHRACETPRPFAVSLD
jgi:predicted O-linked N-acetylglucosamine transferase (SPINDLY family)